MRPFELLGPDHLFAWGVLAAAIAGLSHAARRGAALPVRRLLVAVLLLAYATEHIGELSDGTAGLHESLPLHLCDLALFACVAALLLPSGRALAAGAVPPRPGAAQRAYELAYFWGMAGTSQAIMTPDVPQGFPAQHCLRFFFAHGSIVVAALVLTIGLGCRPAPGAYGRVWVATLGVAAVVLGINALLGTNYMYLLHKPAQPSLMDYFGPRPWYWLSLVATGTVLLAVCAAPFWIIGRRPRRAAGG